MVLLPWFAFQEWTNPGWWSVPPKPPRMRQNPTKAGQRLEEPGEPMSLLSCLDSYQQVARLTGHLAFKMSADMSKRAPEKVNPRNMGRLDWGGKKSQVGNPVRRPPLGFPWWSQLPSSEGFPISCQHWLFQTDSLKCRDDVLRLFVLPAIIMLNCTEQAQSRYTTS